MVAILKILKTKSTTLIDDLFLCQVSKGSAVRSEIKKNCTLVTMATSTILNFINMPKASTHYGEYSYDDQGISEKSSRQKCVEE